MHTKLPLTKEQFLENLQDALDERRVIVQRQQQATCEYTYSMLTSTALTSEQISEGKHVGCIVGAAFPRDVADKLILRENGAVIGAILEDHPDLYVKDGDSDEIYLMLTVLQRVHDDCLGPVIDKTYRKRLVEELERLGLRVDHDSILSPHSK